MKLHTFIISLFLLSNSISTNAQAFVLNIPTEPDSIQYFSDANLLSNEQTIIPEVIPPSPEAVALFRHTDYTVGYGGVIPIEIPLYEIKCGSLRVPISLSYFAEGRRVADVTGPVGLGWTLNAGGMIARTINGCPDEDYRFPSGLKKEHEYDLKCNEDYEFLANLVRYDFTAGYLDTEYDFYSYSFCGYSGKYVFDKGAIPTLLSVNPLKLEANARGYALFTDEYGNNYSFSDKEYASGTFKGSLNQTQSFMSSSHLSEITSWDGIHKINFSYSSSVRYDQGPMSYSCIKISENDVNRGLLPPGTAEAQYENKFIPSSTTIYDILRIREITFNGGKVTFDSDKSGKITQLSVKDLSGNVIKTVKFDYELLETNIYILKKLTFNESSGENKEKYEFEYFPSSGTTIQGKDFWGFKNMRGYMGPTIPSITLEDKTKINGGSNSRQPNEDIITDGILKKIIYPTGGSTEFIYELNKYFQKGSYSINGIEDIKDGKGIRIKKVETSNSNGSKTIKSYQYGTNGTGKMSVRPEDITRPSSDIYVEYLSNRENPYANVSFGHYRKRVFSFEFDSDILELANAPTYYTNITEIIQNENGDVGKIVYEFSNPYGLYPDWDFPEPGGGIVRPGLKNRLYMRWYYSWKSANLRKKEIYEKKGSEYQLKNVVQNEYKQTVIDTLRGFKIHPVVEFFFWSRITDLVNDYGSYAIERNAAYYGWKVFRYADYFITIGKEELQYTYETDYFQSKPVTTQIEYRYNDRGLLVESIKTSGKEVSRETKKYCYEVDYGYFQGMEDLNMLNYPYGWYQYHKIGSQMEVLVDSKTYQYKEWTTDFWAPYKIFTRFSKGQPEVEVHEYDKYGNPLYITKLDSLQTVYVWGYKGENLIAKIENTTLYEVEAITGDLNVYSDSVNPDYSKIDQLRQSLPNAMVTSYNYKPLIGLINLKDPRGVLTFYDYNSAGKLYRIRDHNGKTIKSFYYNLRTNQ